MHFIQAMSKAQTFLVFTQAKEMYKSIIDNDSLVEEEIYTYTKFIHIIQLNNI